MIYSKTIKAVYSGFYPTLAILYSTLRLNRHIMSCFPAVKSNQLFLCAFTALAVKILLRKAVLSQAKDFLLWKFPMLSYLLISSRNVLIEHYSFSVTCSVKYAPLLDCTFKTFILACLIDWDSSGGQSVRKLPWLQNIWTIPLGPSSFSCPGHNSATQ